MRVQFRVQHEVISGLRYLQLVKRKGIKVDRSDEMMGSYAPNTDKAPIYEKKCGSFKNCELCLRIRGQSY